MKVEFYSQMLMSEARAIFRDQTLRWMFLLIFIMALMMRWIIPWASSQYSVDLEPYYPLIMSGVVVLLGPVFVGYIVGILLIDERDEGTLKAIGITPLPIWKYLFWKLSLPVVASIVLTIVSFPIIGIDHFEAGYLPVIGVSSLWAVLLALAMSCFAKNKIQGFILMRFSNLLLLFPILVWFFPNWELLAMVFPTYWPMKSFWMESRGLSSGVFVGVGLLFHLLLIAVLYRRFQSVLRNS
jgi:fluoroquinolone transport system permease protein